MFIPSSAGRLVLGLAIGLTALAGSAGAAAPVITSATTVEVNYDVQNPGDVQFAYRVTASGAPTSYDAVGLPPDAWINPTTGWINGNRSVPGTYDATVTASNADGTGSTVVRFAIHPAAVGVTSSQGVFLTGQSFAVTVNFNTEVTVAPGAGLALAIGPDATAVMKNAVYTSGSGTREIVFGYTVQAGDTDADGVRLLGNALQVEAVRDASGLAVGGSLPVRFFESGITIVADAVAPAPQGPAGSSTPEPGNPEPVAPIAPPVSEPAPTTTPAPETPAMPASTEGGSAEVAAGGSGSGNTPGTAASEPAAVVASSQLVNVSSRMRVVEGDASRTLIVGFVISGSANKRVLVRAVGPTLIDFNVANALSNPGLRIHSSAGVLIAENENWSGVETSVTAGEVGAFPLAAGTADAALVTSLPPGAYTVMVAANGGSGEALAEIYDAGDGSAADTSQVINLSTRGRVDGDGSPLIAGFAIKGDVPRRVLVRAVGTGLTQFGVGDVLADPVLSIHAEDRVIASNDNWQSSAAAEVSAASSASGAFALNNGSTDAAVVLTLEPGAYSAVVKGSTGNASGAALVEVYEVPETNP